MVVKRAFVVIYHYLIFIRQFSFFFSLFVVKTIAVPMDGWMALEHSHFGLPALDTVIAVTITDFDVLFHI